MEGPLFPNKPKYKNLIVQIKTTNYFLKNTLGTFSMIKHAKNN